MKAILLSIRPEHAYNIIIGKKTLELRKSVPKDYVGWIYVYVTKRKPLITQGFYTNDDLKNDILNGTIPFRFWFDDYEEIPYTVACYNTPTWDGYYIDDEIIKKLCISGGDVYNYGKGKDLYAWHIKKLDIFDKPMELIDFVSDKLVINVCGNEFKCYSETASYFARKDQRLTKAPQSYQYVWVKE